MHFMNMGMPVKNILRKLLKERNITPYTFWKALNVGKNTAYRLCGDPDSIPTKKIMDKIVDTFGWLPGDYLVSEEDWNNWVQSLPEQEKKEVMEMAESFAQKTKDGRWKKSTNQVIKFPKIPA